MLGVTNFPTSLDDVQSLGRAANSAVAILTAAKVPADDVIEVDDTAVFGDSHWVVIGEDLYTYDSKTATTFEGVAYVDEGGTESNHSIGEEARGLVVAQETNVLRDGLIAVQTKLGIGNTIALDKLTPLTASRALVSNGSGVIAVSAVTAAELNFLSGATSNIQTQLDALGSALTSLSGSFGSHTHSFASITGKPTTLAGYGITDAADINHTHTFASITSTPTTLAGYGIVDAYPLSGNPSNFLTANQTITLSGDVDGSGTTSIAVTIGAGKVTNDMLAGSIAYSKLILTSSVVVGDINATGTPSASTFLRGDGSWQTVSVSPAGSDTQIQFNDGGAFGGDSGFVYNKTTDVLGVAKQIIGSTQLTESTSIYELATGGARHSLINNKWRNLTPNIATLFSTGAVSGNDAFQAFDGTPAVGNGYIGGLTGTIGIYNPRPFRPATRYSMMANSDTAPKDWTFQGSNNGSSWTTLDTQTNQTGWTGVHRAYTFSNTTNYLYYRINITANNGHASFNIVNEALIDATTELSIRATADRLELGAMRRSAPFFMTSVLSPAEFYDDVTFGGKIQWLGGLTISEQHDGVYTGSIGFGNYSSAIYVGGGTRFAFPMANNNYWSGAVIGDIGVFSPTYFLPAGSVVMSITASGVSIVLPATLTRNAIGSTSTDGYILYNATAAANGAQQHSPRLRLTGQGWKTDATAASRTVDWAIETVPVQGAANPSASLSFKSQVNAGGFTERFNLDSAGNAVAAGYFYSLGERLTNSGWVMGFPSDIDLNIYSASTSAANMFNGMTRGIVLLHTATGIRFNDFQWMAQSGTMQLQTSGRSEMAYTLSSRAWSWSAASFVVSAVAATSQVFRVKGFASQTANLTDWVDSSDALLLSVKSNGLLLAPYTYTAAATVGAQTIDKPSGSVNFAGAATSLVVTNSLVTANSIIFCVVATNDTTMKAAAAVPAAGSFTIYPDAAPTAETRVCWWVLNA